MNTKNILQTLFGLGLLLLSLGLNPAIAQAAPFTANPTQLTQAVQEIEDLDALRSDLASSLAGSTKEPTPQTMQEVCRPVGDTTSAAVKG